MNKLSVLLAAATGTGALVAQSSIEVHPFNVDIPQSKIDQMQHLVDLSPLPPLFYEGTRQDFGVTREWMKGAKQLWTSDSYDKSWKQYQEMINQYPQFKGTVLTKGDNQPLTLHFVHIPSKNPDAIPLLLIHGWPGSFVEFYPMIPYIKDKFHIVIPSLPGYTFSDDAPLNRDFNFDDVAYVLNQLMVKLGYKKYIGQGGDLGSFIGRLLATQYTSNCKAFHFNFIFLAQRPELPAVSTLSLQEQEGVRRGETFQTNGTAYARMHATRPSTIGHVLSASPLALLAWIGDKYLEWTDVPHPTYTQILNVASLWWVTETFPTSIYLYRWLFQGVYPAFWNSMLKGEPLYVKIPMGYSYFPKEIVPTPESWARLTGNLVYFSRHNSGGHFAALERPKELANDVIEFAKIAWKYES